MKYKILVLKLLIAILQMSHYNFAFNARPVIDDATAMVRDMEKFGNDYVET